VVIFEGEFEMMKSMLGFSLALAILPFAACGKPERSQAQTPSSLAPQTPTVNVTTVQSLVLDRQIRLPGELQAWQDTAIYAKVQGFVEEINVDRFTAEGRR
jgi:multidrug efflux pump subunit AcrA (membrane-fusion protein)